MSFLSEFFTFSKKFIYEFLSMTPNLSYLGNIVFDRTYARRIKNEGRLENWNECVIRVIEGNISIIKSHCASNSIHYDSDHWNNYAEKMAISMFERKWSPAGRHLRNMGTEKIIKYGSLSLNNCTAISTINGITDSAVNMFQFLRDQAGVGFDTEWEGDLKKPSDWYEVLEEITDPEIIIRDTLYAYENGNPLPVYRNIKRPSLEILYSRLIDYCEAYLNNKERTRFIVDVMNSIGSYVAGNYSRRSAQIALHKIENTPEDQIFLNLKSPEILEERGDISWASNNSIVFLDTKDFLMIPEITNHIRFNGEPGLINGINVMKYGRLGKEIEEIEILNALGHPERSIISLSENSYLVNPCGEQTLDAGEACNLSTTVPIRCKNFQEFYEVLQYSTIFSSAVALLMTKYSDTNKVMAKNRRLGVSISGLAELFDNYHSSEVIGLLKNGYKTVRETNMRFANIMGVPVSKKVTCIKPDGNLSLLLDTTPGVHYPPFEGHCIRRVQVRKNEPLAKRLIDEGKVPYEDLIVDSKQYVFEFPYTYPRPVRSVKALSIWEQLRYNEILQRFWADNNVSFTGRFNTEEAEILETVISTTIPFIKSISFLPQDDAYLKEKYKQLPYEEISEEEYTERLSAIK